MDTIILVLEILGTVAFAASGAVTAIKKEMDVFGVVMLGLTTAVGGGVIRDLLLGITPPKTFQDPIYAVIAAMTSVIIFILAYLHKNKDGTAVYDLILFIMDTLGLGAFTVAGIGAAWSVSPDFNIFLLGFVGVITGVGGGVLRDIMAGNTPYIFVKHVYACASLLGAAVCIATRPLLGKNSAMLLGLAVVIIMRFLSAHFRWNLPKVKYSK